MIIKFLLIIIAGFVACAVIVEIVWDDIVRKLPISGITFQPMTLNNALSITFSVFVAVFVGWLFNLLMDKLSSK